MRGSKRKTNPVPKFGGYIYKSEVPGFRFPSIKLNQVTSCFDCLEDSSQHYQKVDDNASRTIIECHRSVLAHSTKKDIKEMRGKLLSLLPIFNQKLSNTRKDSKLDKFKGYEVLDLIEQGFTASAKYLQGLLDFESEFRSRPDNIAESNNWPRLSTEKPLLEIIASGLREAEHARKNGRSLLELGTWLFMAVFTALKKKCWYWLSDLLFKTTVTVAKSLKVSKKREAYIRFTYAQFLSEKLGLHIEALRQFSKVRKLSANKNIEGIDLLQLEEFDEDLHSQTCFYLNKICKNLAQEMRSNNPYISIKLCQQAESFIKIAFPKHVHYKSFYGERDAAIYELALSLMAAEEYTSAIMKLDMYQVNCKLNFDTKGICKALYMKAQCFLRLKKRQFAIESLLTLCEVAEKYKLPDMATLGELELASISLSLGSSNSLGTLKGAACAFISSYSHENIEVRKRARVICGIAEGQYLWPSYISMVVATQNSREQFNKLLEWKFCKTPFMDNQIEAFAITLPKRTVQSNFGLVEQIQKFVLPEKIFEILGEDMHFAPKYAVSPMDD